MKKFMIFSLLSVLFGSTALYAQTAENAKKVKSLRFDKEQVTVVYADGQEEVTSGDLVIVGKENSTNAISTIVSQNGKAKETRLYDLQGRRLNGSSQPKGIYLKQENGRVKKVVKK